MSVDPIYNGPSGYVGMLNNPISTVDPNGEEPISITTTIIIAASVSAASYTASVALSDGGFNNWDWGQFGKQVAIGTVSGVAAFGVGTAFQTAYGSSLTFGQQVLKSTVHAHVQGTISEATGGDYLTGATSAFAGSMISGRIGNATQGWESNFGRSSLQIGSSMLLGGSIAEIQQEGSFWSGAAVAGIAAGANDVAHEITKGFDNRAIMRQIRKEGFKSIDLSENPHKAVVQGFKIARLYNRGKLPQLKAQFPDGFRIQHLFDMSTIKAGTDGWRLLSGEKIGKIYQYRNKDLTIRLDSKSFNIGDVDTSQNNRLILYDGSEYWAPHEIGSVNYSDNVHEIWQSAVRFINKY